jgi:hypothetical protein
MRSVGLLVASTIALLGAPARGSTFDVSEFDARMALISEARELEVRCAGLAINEAKRHRSLSLKQAKTLFDAVSERLGSDLGSDIHGMIQASRGALHWSDSTIAAATLAKERAPLLRQCAPILRAARTGVVDKVLSAPSPAPLKLPDLEMCRGYAVEAKASGQPGLAELGKRFEEAAKSAPMASDGSRPVAEAPKLGSDKLEAYLSWACLPTLSAKAPPRP